MNCIKNQAARFVAIGAAALAATSANAAGVDVTAVTAEIGANAAPIAAIGAAVLLIYVGVKAFRWVRQALA